MDDDVTIQFPLLKTKLIDILKLYHDKTKQQVIANGSQFKRDILADTVFALKDITQELLKMTDGIIQSNSLEKQLKTLVHETLPEVVRSAVKSATSDAVELPSKSSNANQEKYAVIVEPESGNFTKETWADAVKKIDGKPKMVKAVLCFLTRTHKKKQRLH